MSLPAHTKLQWHKIAGSVDEINWNANNLSVVHIGERKLALAKSGDHVFACTDRCPHASGSMSTGFIDAMGNIACPLHGYKFSLLNGRNVTGEGYKLKVYAVEERENGIFVGIEDLEVSGW